MSVDCEFSDKLNHKIKLASEKANTLSETFGFDSHISVICTCDQSEQKTVQYSELCIQGGNDDAFPVIRAIWMDELLSKIDILTQALDDYKPANVTTFHTVLQHLYNKVNQLPALAVVIPELEAAVREVEKLFEHQENRYQSLKSHAVH